MHARQLRYFLAIVEHRGYTAAARALHISQPTLTVAMRGLEEVVGAELFRRAGRRVVLSDAGRRFLPLARRLAGELDELDDAARSVGDPAGQRLVLCVAHELVESPVAELVGAYRGTWPDVAVEIVEPEGEPGTAVVHGTADIGFGLRPGPLRRFGRAVTVPVATRRFGLAGEVPDPVLAGPAGSASRVLLDRLPGGPATPAAVARSDRLESLVRAGVGAAVLPLAVCERLGAAGIPFTTDPRLACSVVVTYRAPSTGAAAREFLRLLRRRLETPGGRDW
ncbi:DNA-binding transcriptional regulator, LysR family [Pseudonocardia thermophila]|uniref:DNA-binding transcriptional regulator, LysR family n=1 Tax=Pseudonocardia thermophila TaxID=1848 RepID=A0A1M6P510_PSETH|nr:LysR family transcriptional regulator [Pseudonocardia thermophila]SHK03049.1 DNA-binding transcriptional regulator, LysR family [Pseudonocardia thermophila]